MKWDSAMIDEQYLPSVGEERVTCPILIVTVSFLSRTWRYIRS